MIRNYFKLLFRKQPVFTTINFVGLVMGMTASLMLFRYVRYEHTYDLQSPYAHQIWRVYNQTLNGKTVINQDANTHSAVGPVLKAEVAGVTDFARLYCGNSPEINVLVDHKPFEIKRFYATDPGFLRMFHQKILAGNPQNCLDNPYTVVLSASNAKRLFGKENPLGQMLEITTGMLLGKYTVTAIVADAPENTHLKFDMLVSYATRYAQGHQDNFESYWDYTYFQLAPSANPMAVRQKLGEINQQFLKKEGIQLTIQPFTDIHLKSNLTYELEPNGNARIVSFLALIALLILLIAFVNYINLTTALANERGKEVGIRKVLGASRGALTRQFLLESFVISSLAFAVAVLLLHQNLRWFGTIVGRNLDFIDAPFDPVYWGASVGFVVFISLLSGLYPALQLSGFRPIEVLRGRFVAGNAESFRKGLVIVQFACSAGLIFGVLVVGKQLSFLKNHELGIQLDQIVAIKSGGQLANDSLASQKLALFKADCARLVGIKGVASSNVVPGLGINTISGSNRPLHWVKKPDFAKITSYFVETDEHFFDLYGVRLLAGKHQFFSDRRARFSTVAINKSMLKALGFPSAEAAIGELIAYENSENNATTRIGAVIDDFHIESLKNTPKPTLYYCFAPEELNYLSLKIAPQHIASSLAEMQKSWKKIYPDQPFSYWFLDETFAQQYRTETQFGRVFGLFALFAILISCLGVLGLTAYNVQRRQKEIGIRKVLGASVVSVVALLSKDFLKLILVAILVGCPIAYYLMNNWLEEFAYRTSISWWIFGLTGLGVLLISLGTVSLQSIKAALMNPVKSLKTE